MLDGKGQVLACDVALRVGGCAHAEAGLDQLGDEVLGKGILRARGGSGVGACRQVAAQGEDVLDPGLVHLGDLLLQLVVRERDAGEMRHGAHGELLRDHGGDLRRGAGVARAARGVRNAHKVRMQLGKAAGDLARVLERHLSFGRKHLERDGLRACGLGLGKDIGDLHALPPGADTVLSCTDSTAGRAIAA